MYYTCIIHRCAAVDTHHVSHWSPRRWEHLIRYFIRSIHDMQVPINVHPCERASLWGDGTLYTVYWLCLYHLSCTGSHKMHTDPGNSETYMLSPRISHASQKRCDIGTKCVPECQYGPVCKCCTQWRHLLQCVLLLDHSYEFQTVLRYQPYQLINTRWRSSQSMG